MCVSSFGASLRPTHQTIILLPRTQVVLRMGASSSSVSQTFSDLCLDMKRILDRLGVVPFVEGACAQALGKLEPLVAGLAQLQPMYAAESNELVHSQKLCDDYMRHVASKQVWTDAVQQGEEEARERLLSHWQEVCMFPPLMTRGLRYRVRRQLVSSIPSWKGKRLVRAVQETVGSSSRCLALL